MNKTVKCVIWDLDETVWNGILLENESVQLRPGILEVFDQLDQRGILQSIASRNDNGHAMQMLRDFGIDHYFLYPQINWGAKSSSVQTIAKELNIGTDSLAFVDDQPFERDEVASVMPDVLCIDASNIDTILELPQMKPRFITQDSRNRRSMMKADERRKIAEESFQGPQEQFLSSLQLQLTIHRAKEEDLQRAEELTVRTHQLNSTGYTYSYEELAQLSRSENHLLLVAELTDIYGTYGKIGLALVEVNAEVWTLMLLLMSCRVMSRGVGGVLLQQIIQSAMDRNAALQAEFKSTDRNRMMYMTFKFAGFIEKSRDGDFVLFDYALDKAPTQPSYVQVDVREVSA
ncbi:HAD superfamily phosphatase (TIGR01681 family)/FkbH-like protein [Paenibacillus cellulosilyticus]|uniref:HAD superfamily phosphatase (TIGR01681 family)/FkbH-like protein n=1 Tax=Paenibacillus cellulosilyticus TaxID=375489 RepID=A0A2V2Z3Q5_9BACL|nr:HAD-IIIC family phosphatase [Paenibacillus cellulosilyticus]PWW04853.1 HAD superfamily phosphatase (TIGR01681 family)/FkbH-like protein [Paenibacillus cellulosilyticus]QKS45966.1 HAD-IIIC family phosphatase [Paenibacillus cellulosilyticus]